MSNFSSSSGGGSRDRVLYELKNHLSPDELHLVQRDSQLAVETIVERLSEVTRCIFSRLLLLAGGQEVFDVERHQEAAQEHQKNHQHRHERLENKAVVFSVNVTIRAWLKNPDHWHKVYLELLDAGLIQPCGQKVSLQRSAELAEARVGLAVVRNDQDWEFGDLDGRRGLPGKIVAIDPHTECAAVVWQAQDPRSDLFLPNSMSSSEEGMDDPSMMSAGKSRSAASLASVGGGGTRLVKPIYRLGTPQTIGGTFNGTVASSSSSSGSYRANVRNAAASTSRCYDLRVFGKFQVPAHVSRAMLEVTKRSLVPPEKDCYFQRSALQRRNHRVRPSDSVFAAELHSHAATAYDSLLEYLARGAPSSLTAAGARADREGRTARVPPWMRESLRARDQLGLVNRARPTGAKGFFNLTSKGFEFVFSARHRQLWTLIHSIVDGVCELYASRMMATGGQQGHHGDLIDNPAGAEADMKRKASMYSLLLQLAQACIGQPLLMIPERNRQIVDLDGPVPDEVVDSAEVKGSWMFQPPAAAETEQKATETAILWTHSVEPREKAISSTPGAHGAAQPQPHKRAAVLAGLTGAQTEFLYRLEEIGVLFGKAVYDVSKFAGSGRGGTETDRCPDDTYSLEEVWQATEAMAQSAHSMHSQLYSRNGLQHPGGPRGFLRGHQLQPDRVDEAGSSNIKKRLTTQQLCTTPWRCVYFYPTAFCAALFHEDIGLSVTHGEFHQERIIARSSSQLKMITSTSLS